ncbi:hypothetical protein ANCCEY_12653 [Ancylostoma ceylanicum]|uniref:Uncharacterized protein n=1 Tax=Ancylostoma ceylanicum TaxID=53326 RepID=A0A0D6LKT0_9BILA|nr:hypothetical protein ANCCEY_12653 [Ancylostoma ceylanicum]
MSLLAMRTPVSNERTASLTQRGSDGHEKSVAAEEAALSRDGGMAHQENTRAEQDEGPDEDQPAPGAF